MIVAFLLVVFLREVEEVVVDADGVQFRARADAPVTPLREVAIDSEDALGRRVVGLPVLRRYERRVGAQHEKRGFPDLMVRPRVPLSPPRADRAR